MRPAPDSTDGLDHLGLLASAIAGRPLQVEPGRPGDLTWTDGRRVQVDLRLGPRERIESLLVQASLLAAGSLEPDVVRRLGRRNALASRYLAVEGHRALAAIAPILPASLRSLCDPAIAARVDSPAASLALARSRAEITDAPRQFGAIHPRRLRLAFDPAERSSEPEPRGVRERPGPARAEIAGDEDDGGAIAADFFSSPDGGGGTAGRLLARLLSTLRRIEGGGSTGADAPLRAAHARPHGSATAFATAEAGAMDDDAHPGAGRRREDPTEGRERGRGQSRVRYPEWDAARRRYRRDWCTVHEIEPPPRDGEPLVVSASHGLRRSLARLGMGLDACHRQTRGDDIDIDAAVEAQVELMAGTVPHEAIYVDSLRRRRDLSVLFLLDISGSSAEAAASGRTVHAQQRDAAATLTAALHEIGDRVALYAFQSRGRSAVDLLAVKRFEDDFDLRAIRRLQGLVPGAYSRLGAAIRHGTALLRDRGATSRRLLVVLSDGLAYDHGYEPAHGAADARRALGEARREGIGCLCLTIGASTDAAALGRVFGSAAHATIPGPAWLGQAIGPLFRSALRSAEVRRRVA